MALPRRNRPKRVAIVAMGLSHRDYVLACASMGGRWAQFDEVWAINAMGGVIDCDLVFMMDTPDYLTNKGETNLSLAGYKSWLSRVKVPVFTSFPNKDLAPTSVPYPLEEVLNDIRFPYLNGTVAYAVAYAILTEVKELSLFGCDYTYPGDKHGSESGRGNVEFLLGIAVSRGMDISVAQNSSLLDTNLPEREKFYGYEGRVNLTTDSTGQIKVGFKETTDAPDSP